jgi:hypothetical protein
MMSAAISSVDAWPPLDANSPWYLWLTLLFAFVAAVTGVWGLSFGYSERARRRAERFPRITTRLRPNRNNGWYHCSLSVLNRLDSSVRFTRAEVTSPRGFLLAPGAGQFGQDVDARRAGATINPDWVLAARPEPERSKHLFVRPPARMRGTKPVTIAFTVLVEDADREEMTYPVTTNAIDWGEQD